jgi:hypothetical protein
VRTPTVDEQRPKSGGRQVLATVLLVLPAGFALFASSWLSNGSQYIISGLWFMYQVSRYLAYVGILVAASLTAAAIVRRTVSAGVVMLMASSTLAAIFLLWYAAHIYRSPW